jgi:hypothetical protein
VVIIFFLRCTTVMMNKYMKAKKTKGGLGKKGIKTVGTKLEVWRGKAKKTKGGLGKKDLTLSASGKVVSKKQQERGFELAEEYDPRLTQAAPFGS